MNTVPPPSFVGDNYLCESGNPGEVVLRKLFTETIQSGMESSVKGSAIAMENLLHGSV